MLFIQLQGLYSVSVSCLSSYRAMEAEESTVMSPVYPNPNPVYPNPNPVYLRPL